MLYVHTYMYIIQGTMGPPGEPGEQGLPGDPGIPVRTQTFNNTPNITSSFPHDREERVLQVHKGHLERREWLEILENWYVKLVANTMIRQTKFIVFLNYRVLLDSLAQMVQTEKTVCRERREKLEEKADLETL